ncbi:SPOR domain-containing protein [Paucibacter sp. DJ1R-11]|uniref:SPOR domain-containing protein n=1 Tax=Paucibacter sp. DJ1R-11 TaxID=2893556 RepID=UPI0021E47FF6|nr:SPOR domain-containing protein [Paucibacter sp. DJ1R-11]MCV2365937.1 SPOR domain-containing protein [Paucibacter sp. DJ1R-11]
MGLLSFFKRDKTGPAAKRVADSADAVQQLRLRARHRLIGAAVLVGVGVIGFPLVFETQPRPIPVDLPIDIPSKDAAAPLAIPQPRPVQPSLPPLAAAEEKELATPAASSNRVSEGKVALAPAPLAVPAQAADKPIEKLPEKPAEKVAEKSLDKAVTKPAEKLSEKPSEKTVDKRNASGSSPEAARVQALLEGRAGTSVGKPADAVPSTRHILQVGAFADSKSAHEVRMKVEHLGLKTYTQAVDTAAGKRIRVRLGPYANREEADKAAAKLKAAGLSAAVLTL